MTNTQDLDCILRERGRKKLKKKLNEMFLFFNDLQVSYHDTIVGFQIVRRKNAEWKTPENATIMLLRNALFDALVADLNPKWEQKEVDEFLLKTDQLKVELDELYETVENHSHE